MSDVLERFQPAVANWFRRTYATPTLPQTQAWPLMQSGRHVLIAAPTGSGKTLAAFLAAIDALVRRGLAGPGDGDLFGHALPDRTFVVYVSPLKALSNDVRINLEGPLAGIRAELEKRGLPDVEIRTMVRTARSGRPSNAAPSRAASATTTSARFWGCSWRLTK